MPPIAKLLAAAALVKSRIHSTYTRDPSIARDLFQPGVLRSQRIRNLHIGHDSQETASKQPNRKRDARE